MMWRIIVNGLLYQAGWFLCILGGNFIAGAATILIIALHLTWVSKYSSEWRWLILVLGIGVIIDSLMFATGVLKNINGNLFMPFWLICIWLLFATTIRHCFAFLNRSLWLCLAVGLLFPPLTYYAGAKLNGTVQLGFSSYTSIIVIACVWACLLPALILFQRHWFSRVSS